MKRLLLILLLILPAECWASDLSDAATALTPGSWVKLTVNSQPSDIATLNMSDGLLPYSMKMQWDSMHHLGYYYGGAHLNFSTYTVCDVGHMDYDPFLCAEAEHRLLKYDEAANTWVYLQDAITMQYSDGIASGHSDQAATIDPATGDVYHYAWPSRALSRFNYSTQTWEALASSSTIGWVFNIDSIAWFPEAHGLVLYSAEFGEAAYYDKNTDTWAAISGVSSLADAVGIPVALYNPVQHNMLIGGGESYKADSRKFWILSYSSGTFSLSPQHITASIDNLGGHQGGLNNSYVTFDADSQGGHIMVDPVTGHYIVLLSSGDGTTELTYDVNIPNPDNASLDTWSLLAGSNPWPSTFKLLGNSGGAGYIGSTDVPEYGISIVLIEMTNGDVETWLYKYSGVSFADKCALSGVLICHTFDDDSELRYFWGSSDNGDSQRFWLHICDDALGGTYTNYPYDFTSSTYANVQSVLGPSGTCNYPRIDTSVKFDGTGSLKFPVPNHSSQADGGEFTEPFKKYMDGTFGYIGPDAGMDTTNDAHHEGDDFYLQVVMRHDSTFLTKIHQMAFQSTTFTTTGAGATTVSVNTSDCMSGSPLYPYAIHDTYPLYWPNYPTLTPTSSDVNTVGRTIRFVWGMNFDTTQNFTISSLVADGPTMDTHCSMVLSASPTPSGQGGITPGGGLLPLEGWGLISSDNPTNGPKSVGVFGDSSSQTHQNPAAQILLDFNQLGLMGAYFYKQDFSIGTLSGQNERAGCDDVYPQIYEKGLSDMTEPPCIRIHADTWQEYTVHIKLIASGPHNIYESWVDGVLTTSLTDYNVRFQESMDSGTSNGMGAFNLSPYNTAKDPNQSHGDTAVWVDNLIVSTQPIPMTFAGDSPSPPAPSGGNSSRLRLRR